MAGRQPQAGAQGQEQGGGKNQGEGVHLDERSWMRVMAMTQ
jgi:hypothetical protein